MPGTVKRNAVVVFALAMLFWWVFEFAKHDATVGRVIPFGDDPYDAVGSFGFIAAVLLALLSLIKSFARFPGSLFPESLLGSGARLYVVRTQAAVVFCVLVAVASDGIAMARHVTTWWGIPGQAKMLEVLGGLVLLAAAVLVMLRGSEGILAVRQPGRWRRAGLLAAIAGLLLGIYPERAIDSLPEHLLTVFAGAVLLFAPVGALTKAFVPAEPQAAVSTAVPAKRPGARRLWGLVSTVGISCRRHRVPGRGP